ncbi:hypothetical protein ECG_06716 [Echinococcus granulosus]|uniref:Adenylate cyclase n=1 Tax=Echinococcus granulosus TaxID=6210 RepID=A0A068WNE0_ECHGR|nr:hypothetical protein ECG_06716 [Echinococcus granulosus]CDS19190.1 adenylate cyclase [Echinococcus granulosus]
MERSAIYALVFIIGILTAATATCILFSRMQYLVYRLNKVSGITPCGEGEDFCQGTANQSRFDGMDKTAREQWVQSQSAFVATTMSFVSGIVGLFTIVPLGFISDRFGRKCGLLIAYTGFAIEAVLNALVMLLNLPLWILIFATLPSSILGNGLYGIMTQLYVCIVDLTEQKAEIMERRLSVVPQPIDSETPPPPLERRRTRSILEKCEPKSVTTVQSSMASERLSFIALFEGCTGITLSVGTIAIGPVIQKFGFVFSGWVVLVLTGINAVLSVFLPNTRDLWYNPAVKEGKSQEFDQESRRKLLSVSPASTDNSPNPSSPLPKRSCCLALRQAFAFVTVPIIIEIIANLLAGMVAMTDIPILNLYFIGNPFTMTISQVGLAIGLRTTGCSIASGLFVLFNMFYLQPRLATPNAPALETSKASTSEGDVLCLTGAEVAAEKKVKILEARRIILFSLGGIFLVMAVSRFFYGLSSNFSKPTCFVLLFIGMTLNAFQFYGPLARALLSGLVTCEVQGLLYALVGFADALGSFIGSTALPALFATTVFMNAGFVFHMGALILALAFVLTAINIYLLLYGKYK